jgi:hypothetical protein
MVQATVKKKIMRQRHDKLREQGIEPAKSYEENRKRLKEAHGR